MGVFDQFGFVKTLAYLKLYYTLEMNILIFRDQAMPVILSKAMGISIGSGALLQLPVFGWNGFTHISTLTKMARS